MCRSSPQTGHRVRTWCAARSGSPPRAPDQPLNSLIDMLRKLMAGLRFVNMRSGRGSLDLRRRAFIAFRQQHVDGPVAAADAEHLDVALLVRSVAAQGARARLD